MFEVSVLDRYTSPTAGQRPSEVWPTVVNNSDKSNVDWILNPIRHYGKLHCLLQWAVYSYVQTSWEPAKNLGNAQELIDELH